jgi:hypothetical protein
MAVAVSITLFAYGVQGLIWVVQGFISVGCGDIQC